LCNKAHQSTTFDNISALLGRYFNAVETAKEIYSNTAADGEAPAWCMVIKTME
jgi:hypothetical protein